MRLIDTDKIHRSRARITEGSKSSYKEWFSASEIDNAPTVEAIPIEFIEKFRNQFEPGDDDYKLIDALLDIWRIVYGE